MKRKKQILTAVILSGSVGLGAQLDLRSRCSGKRTNRTHRSATAPNATNDSGATGARSPTSGTNAGATRYYS